MKGNSFSLGLPSSLRWRRAGPPRWVPLPKEDRLSSPGRQALFLWSGEGGSPREEDLPFMGGQTLFRRRKTSTSLKKIGPHPKNDTPF
ncbi:hypothetical protein Nepgr_009149 [Nepenthes gracilis]|uniref:Uncharacterized protein n=1 Tax=Nepenthes gracilis TaxID=150966 RepID=A0AAD3SAE3_NEPGR|nr:hypothetical protein Nepgr_009149 [Nepenthes gracilis]